MVCVLPGNGGSGAHDLPDPTLTAAGDDGPDAATVKSDLQKALSAAPAEIRPDLQTLADVEIPILDGKIPKDQIEQRLEDSRLQTAIGHIAAWSQAHC
jgi:hypothetical protein